MFRRSFLQAAAAAVGLGSIRLDAGWLDKKVHEIKDRYPAMPGIAFYQSDLPDTPQLRELVAHCDRLSGRLWE